MQHNAVSQEQIKENLEKLDGWDLSDDQKMIFRSYQHTSFLRAIAFVHNIAILAEEANHHPDIFIHYKKVTIQLSTHDAGGLTELDFLLARQIEGLYQAL